MRIQAQSRPVTNPYAAAANLPQRQPDSHTARASALVSISAEAMARLEAEEAANPAMRVAENAARELAYGMDQALLELSAYAGGGASSAGAAPADTATEQWFRTLAAQIRRTRISIYEAGKAAGLDGKEILQKLRAFMAQQPQPYRDLIAWPQQEAQLDQQLQAASHAGDSQDAATRISLQGWALAQATAH